MPWSYLLPPRFLSLDLFRLLYPLAFKLSLFFPPRSHKQLGRLRIPPLSWPVSEVIVRLPGIQDSHPLKNDILLAECFQEFSRGTCTKVRQIVRPASNPPSLELSRRSLHNNPRQVTMQIASIFPVARISSTAPVNAGRVSSLAQWA